MDFSPRRLSSKGRFSSNLPFFSMQKAKHGWTAPGIAKRQSSTEWLGRKTNVEYSKLPKLSPTSENHGRDSRMSSGSTKSCNSAADEPAKVLFDDTENISKGVDTSISDGDMSDDDFKFREKFKEEFRSSTSLRSPDVKSTDSSRAALRLACSSPPPLPCARSGNLISFKEEQPEELLIDTLCDPTHGQSGSNGNPPASLNGDNDVFDNRNGTKDKGRIRQKQTSLETIRQQIRQIEDEIAQNRAQQGRKNGGFHGMSRHMQSSYSSQSIPTDLATAFHPRSHMQRAHSVDVAVHSAISDIQSAVRHNSMIRLMTSPGLERPVVEEDEDSVWVKRDSSAQTEILEPSSNTLMLTNLPQTISPEMDEELENENVYLLRETSLQAHPCDNRIGSLPRPVTARRPSCQSTHELIDGVLFRCCYLGSTHLFSDSRPTKTSRLTQAQEAVGRIKAPDGESQPMTEVDLFISIEKIMVLNVDIQDSLMEHPLRTISYIADIGDLVVLMVKRGLEDLSCESVLRSSQPKMLCHVFQSDEASLIAQTIGNAFQVAYIEYLKANGIQDDRYLRHLDYLEVLNSQEMSTNELELFASKDKQTNVVIPKQKGEILGVVIVESGWGSMLPTVIFANMCPGGPAARCGKLSIGDQLISIDGISLVGLPLAQCQTAIKNVKNHTVVKLTIVSCPPVIEVKIKRPDTRYQLGFSVQNGIICSLLRGGIAERGGIRVGHRIIEINSHDAIVSSLAHSVGEIELKTMPSSIFRLLTGQDVPVYI